MERYENTTGTSRKFWSVEQKGAEVVVRWGPIGGTVTKKVHDLGSAAKAAQKRDALVRAKLRGGYRLVPNGPAPARGPSTRLKPLPRTVIKPQRANTAVTKQLQAIAKELANADAVPMPLIHKLLATSAKAPYAPDEWQRSIAELDALKALVERTELDAARFLWFELVKQWATQAPVAGHGYWPALARHQQALQAQIPAVPVALRRAIAQAWALAVVQGRFEYQNGTLAAKPPTDGSAAWRQACIAITQQKFDAARAAIAAVRDAYGSPADVLEIMTRREEGDRDGAIAAFRDHLARCLKRPRKENWAEIAGLYILLGMQDARVAREILGSWRVKKGYEGEREFFRLLVAA